jgi:hypothetical protein
VSFHELPQSGREERALGSSARGESAAANAPVAIGRVRVSLAGQGQVDFEPKSGCDERLRGLWARYRRRHPQMARQRERYLQMLELGRKSAGRLRRPHAADAANQHAAEQPAVDPPAAARRAPRAWVSSSRKRNKARAHG